MNELFSIYGPDFSPFTAQHLIPVIVIAAACCALFFLRRKLREMPAFKKTVSFAAPGLTLLLFLTNLLWLLSHGMFDVRYSLPLQLCDITFALVFFVYIFPCQPLVEIMYYVGIGGALQALATPALGYGFPHFAYFFFFAEHGLVIFTALYFAIIKKAKFTFYSVLRAMLYLTLIGLGVLAINFILGSNYMFLMHKPGSTSLFDLLGPWPWYLLSCEAIGFVTFCLLYAPVRIAAARSRKNGAGEP